MKKIKITDITLKKLSEEKGVSLLFREKTAVAACADSIGADAVELAAVKNLREDTIIYKTIAQNVSNASVTIPTGFTTETVENAWECIKEAKKPCLQVELPASTVQMEYLFRLKADKMIEKIKVLTEKAKELCPDVELSLTDATRAERDFVILAAKTGEDAGANIITVSDDAGVALPEEIAELVKDLKEAVKVPVYVQVSDKLGMAVASAVAAVRAGADGIKCSMTPGEALEVGKLSDTIAARGGDMGIETDLKNTRIHASIEDMLESINHDVKDSDNDISDKKKILLDCESTLTQVAQAAELLGYDLSDEDYGNVHKALMQVLEKKDSVGAKEFEALIASSAMQAPSTYHLESYTASCGNLGSSMAQVTLRRGDELLSGVSTGDGPIDAVFRAVEQCIGFHYELDDFQIQAVTEGKEALGTALVRLRDGGRLYSGNGISADIVAASIRAYINALNKIVFEEE